MDEWTLALVFPLILSWNKYFVKTIAVRRIMKGEVWASQMGATAVYCFLGQTLRSILGISKPSFLTNDRDGIIFMLAFAVAIFFGSLYQIRVVRLVSYLLYAVSKAQTVYKYTNQPHLSFMGSFFVGLLNAMNGDFFLDFLQFYVSAVRGVKEGEKMIPTSSGLSLWSWNLGLTVTIFSLLPLCADPTMVPLDEITWRSFCFGLVFLAYFHKYVFRNSSQAEIAVAVAILALLLSFAVWGQRYLGCASPPGDIAVSGKLISQDQN